MKFLKHSLIVLLSAMVFITSSGLTVNLHYCAGKLANVSLQDSHENCMMSAKENTKKDCPNSITKKDPCCQNHKVVAKADNKNIDSKLKEKTGFLQTFVFIKSYFTSLFSFSSEETEKENHKEVSIFPILKEGLYLLLQNFRN
ncbi:hypothetical protein I5M32_06105 [Pedobacter sp. SD-b]|uniref:Secreted protein n=1 Tax=Pedobacter segetis TaxID=2793069 RepID=A0ABS1BI16_9SPHI|nr:hypothetical protein [Pedobacter segetis]MBK0382531.1 hypothetical protein [Pedobacter segetis]